MSGKPKPVKVDGGGDGGDKEESKPKPKMEVDDEKMWILDSAKFTLCHSETDENNHTVFYFEEVQKWEDVDKKDDFMYETRYLRKTFLPTGRVSEERYVQKEDLFKKMLKY